MSVPLLIGRKGTNNMEHDIVFDIETEKSFDEVGGRDHLTDLGVTVVGVYSYSDNSYYAYEANEFQKLTEVLKGARRLIGFNIRDFDIPVLAPHVGVNLFSLQMLDLMDDVARGAGFRISLDSLAKATLGAEKSGHGLDAITWWRAGEKEKVKSYCLQDVRLTKDLYEYGSQRGEVYFISKYGGGKVTVPVRWREISQHDVPHLVKRAYDERKTIVVKLLMSSASKENPETRVDVTHIDRKSFEGYSHERKATRTFPFDAVASITLTDHMYLLEQDVQQTLI